MGYGKRGYGTSAIAPFSRIIFGVKEFKKVPNKTIDKIKGIALIYSRKKVPNYINY